MGIGKKVTGATSAAFLLATSVVTLGFVSQATPAAALRLLHGSGAAVLDRVVDRWTAEYLVALGAP